MTTSNTNSHYTAPMAGEAVTVKVAEFRHAIEHLERKIHVDYHACVGAHEIANWAETTRRVGAELINMVCKRATKADLDRRERALDRSAKLLSRACDA